jgi:hypothetical protein
MKKKFEGGERNVGRSLPSTTGIFFSHTLISISLSTFYYRASLLTNNYYNIFYRK